MVAINTYEELVSYAANCLDATKDFEVAEIGTGLDYTIKITGAAWDGSIDYRLAKYVLELQSAVNKIFKETCGEDNLSAYKNEIVVKFKVSAGCSLVEVKFSKTIKAFFSNMESKHKLALGITLMIVVGGYLSYRDYSEYKKEQLAAATNDQQLARMERMFDKVAEKLPDAERPTRALIAKMGDADTIKFPWYEVPLTTEQIKVLYPRKPRTKPSNVYVDDTYLVHNIRYDVDPVRITVEKGADRFDCGVALNDDELKSLYSKAMEQHGGGDEFELPLQISARFTKSGGVRDAVIIGIGAPRERAVTVQSLFAQ